MMPTRFAGLLKRFIAFIVDLIIVLVVIGVLEAAIGALWLPFELVGDFLHWINLGRWFDHLIYTLPGWLRGVPYDFPKWITLTVYALYHAVFEASVRQATPGKMIFGIFVTDEQGRRLSWQRGLGRGFGRVVSLVICFIGFLIALLAPRNQALHDMMASTLVLEPAGPPPPQTEGPAGKL
jgi:uncharacterized RDD family membrane protein YckC